MSSIQKQTHMLLLVRGLTGISQRLSWWILFLSAALVSAECHVPTWHWELAHPVKKHVLGPGPAVGLLGQGYLRNTDQVITAPPFVAPTLEIQTTTFSIIWNDSLILIQGLVRSCQHAPKLQETRLPCKVWVVRAVKNSKVLNCN